MDKQREKLIELLNSVPADVAGNRGVGAIADHLLADEEIKHAFELLKAEKEGRLIVPPVKVGDTVYIIVEDEEEEETEIIFDIVEAIEDYRYSDTCLELKMPSVVITMMCRIPYTAFGKVVFLSREDAEKALNNKGEKK